MKSQKILSALSLYVLVSGCILINSCAPKHERVVTSAQTSVHVSTISHASSPIASMNNKEVKPGAPVLLGSAKLVTLSANQAAAFSILLNTTTTVGNMHVEIIPGEGLQLLDTEIFKEFTLNGNGEYSLPVKVLASTDGRYYLNLHVSMGIGEDISTRTFAIIVQVGSPVAIEPPPMLQNTSLQKTSSGGKVISLPAQETVIDK